MRDLRVLGAAVFGGIVVQQEDAVPAIVLAVDGQGEAHAFGVAGAAEVEGPHPLTLPGSTRTRFAAPAIQSLQVWQRSGSSPKRRVT